MQKTIVVTVAVVFLLGSLAPAQYSAIGPEPGKAKAQVTRERLSVGNAALELAWDVPTRKISVAAKQKIGPASAFVIVLRDGSVLAASDMRAIGKPVAREPKVLPGAARMSDRIAGREIVVELMHGAGRIRATWRAVLRDGSNYIRQELTLRATKADVPMSEVRLIDIAAPHPTVAGAVKGSPVTAGDMFLGFEHPLSTCTAEGEHVTCSLKRELPLRAGQSVTYSSVIGVAPAGQMRRAFLNYIERERAHPYRPFLHYNSWYDLGFFTKYDERAALNVIDAFGTELVKKRGVKLDSFLFDDGWDEPTTLWSFHSGFPRGFAPLREEAAKFGAAPGVWLSPWGGYSKPREQRLKFGKAAGLETNEGGFALSGPKYYERFRATMLDFVRLYGVNQFKIDGTGNANRVFPGSRFDSDFDAAINLISELRTVKSDLYINLTTGTYPSPFWLRYADSIWRDGEDHSFAGVGSARQQWITYRDAATYKYVVQRGPLFPLNSLMLHGLIFARHANRLDGDPGHDFTDEVHDYFGTGTQLQEMYISPSLLRPEDWDTLAEAAKWSRANASVLVDTHWIGGDPGKLEAYGWAAWSPNKAILVLRNPSDKPQSLAVNTQGALELPGAPQAYVAHSPWQADAKEPSVELPANGGYTFQLKPFQVLVLEAVPKTK